MNFLFMSNKKARTLGLFGIVIYMVRLTGIEPAHLSAQEPKSCVSANSTNSAQRIDFIIFIDNCQGFYSELFLLTIVYIALF